MAAAVAAAGPIAAVSPSNTSIMPIPPMRPVTMNAEPRGKVPSPRQLTGEVRRGVS